MDCLTFIASLVESLAWPVTVIALVALLKDEIVKIAPFLKRFKAGPIEAEFERDVKELKESTQTQGTATTSQVENPATKNFLYQLAELHPRSAILESWVRLEAAARAALSSNGSVSGNYIPAARLAEPLARAELVTEGQVTLYHELRRLRNEVAHAVHFYPPHESARAYIDLAAFLQSHLEGQTK
jgi:hypothetical protein